MAQANNITERNIIIAASNDVKALDRQPLFYAPLGSKLPNVRPGTAWAAVVGLCSRPAGATLASIVAALDNVPGRAYGYVGDSAISYGARSWLNASTLGVDKRVGLCSVAMSVSDYLAALPDDSRDTEAAALAKHEAALSDDDSVITYHVTLSPDSAGVANVWAAASAAYDKALAESDKKAAGKARRECLRVESAKLAQSSGVILASTGQQLPAGSHAALLAIEPAKPAKAAPAKRKPAQSRKPAQ